MSNENLITLPDKLGRKINSMGITNIRTDSSGKPTFKYTKEELTKVTKLTYGYDHNERYDNNDGYDHNDLYDALVGIEFLPNLEKLWVRCNDVTLSEVRKSSISEKDVESIEQCGKLSELAIVNQSKIHKIYLGNLKKLKYLNVSCNYNLCEVLGIDQCSELEKLYISGNESLMCVAGLQEAILNNNLSTQELDIRLFPSVIRVIFFTGYV